MVRRIAARAAGIFAGAFVFLGFSAAIAGDEAKCADQYTLEEQLILEWAALGGDPHAQFAMAQCALPKGEKSFTSAEKTFAVKWLTIAACDLRGGDAIAERDMATRKLRAQGDLSFRRFGGARDGEKWSRREKKFQEYRDARSQELLKRFDRLEKIVDETEREDGKMALAKELANLGPAGLLRLSGLSACGDFNASKTFEAAAWSAAADAWARYDLAAVYGDSGREGWAIAGEADARLKTLTRTELKTAEFERAELTKADPIYVAQLEERAALGELANLTQIRAKAVSHEAPLETAFSGPAVTVAAQYALEALGFMEFVNGPDNDYGPATIAAAARAQEEYGRPATRWLSHSDVRQMVCDAATDADDPVSYYHLGLMFSRGWGYPVDLARARFAIDSARSTLSARLKRDRDLPDWKKAAYPVFAAQIGDAKKSIDAAWAALPARRKSSRQETLSKENLCW